MPDLLDSFHKKLHVALVEELTKRQSGLAMGSATSTMESPISTAENYAAQVSYIKALNDVLDKCEEIEKEMYGTAVKEEPEYRPEE